jgi:AcrR family transcriptional regulator
VIGVPEDRTPEAPAESRRDRLRRETLDDIKQHALAQVAEGGAAALSLNAIGRAMGMSGPAVYRYFASRDAVLGALVADGYASLTQALEEAADRARRRAPERRLLAIAEAYRDWARERPQLYALLFGLRPAGYVDADETIAAIDGSMTVLLETLGALAADREPAPSRDALDGELVRWSRLRGTNGDDAPPDPAILRLGVLGWTRLHGLVGLELAGVLGDMGLDPARLVAAEMATLAAAARGADEAS